ncbi:MAG TPA: hypothetical protein VFE60_17865 [Roseiarcus sp.]|nr:hypothetical protein [Roseiarcus sp.]
MAMVLLGGLAAAGWYGLMHSPAHLATAHVPSIAVLPFDDMSRTRLWAIWATG